MSGKDLIDLPWIPYSIQELEKKAKESKADVLDVEVLKEVGDPAQPRTFYMHAKVLGYEVGMKMRLSDEVMAKCQCEDYKPESPCIHIAAVWVKAYAPKIGVNVDKEERKDLERKVKEAAEDLEKLLEEEEKEIEIEEPKIDEIEEPTQEPEPSKPVPPVVVTKVEPVKEKTAKTVVNKVNQVLEIKAAEIADKLDEEQMRIIDLTDWSEDVPLVYEIKFRTKDGREVSRHIISWNGLIMAANMQGGIQVVKVEFAKTPDGKDCAIATAVNTKTGVQMVGISTRYNNEQFKWETLASKAIRNAIKKLIDPKYIQDVINYAKQRKALATIPIRELATP